jgi:thiamine pyrophosphate-dependent acetolactate synthase large subunit-like protein
MPDAAANATVADAIGARLGALGVDTVFGLVGSGNLVVTNALRDAGARFVAARHEGGAVAMADGWARVTGRVGVCTVHQGPGLTNTLTALAEAAKSRTPLLVLAGDTSAAALTSNFRIDQHDLVTSVGAIAERVRSAAGAEADAARALRRAAIERCPVVLNMAVDLQAQPAATERRPVVLNMAIDLQAQPAVAGAEPVAVPPARPPRPDPDDLAAVAARLTAARRPLIVAGRGAVVAGAGPALRALGERCGALLANSAPAQGIFHGDPFALGICGGFSSPLAAELLPQADVVLACGAGLNHWTTRHGALIGSGATVVQIDIEAQAIGANRRADLAVVGDAAAAAHALAEQVPAASGWRSDDLADRIATHRWRDEPLPASGAPGVVDPRALSIALADLLPADKTVVIDSGHFTGWPAMYLDVRDPRHWLFVNGFQAVGLGLGCALGAAVAAPERLTVAAVGDGGLFLALSELETAARVGARLLIVVYDDAAYGAEVHHFGPQGRDLETVRFPVRDLAAIARASGIAAVEVRAVADLAAVAAWLQDGDGPLLVDAKVDPKIVADWLPDALRGG